MALDGLDVELTVVLGRTAMPLGRLLRLGRGAVIALDPSPEDEVEILANGLAVAKGRVVIEGSAISVEVTELVRPVEVTREPGATIGGRVRPPATTAAG
jgi:flagellar motor switch protein FliN/FliY